jgi:predicted nucleic acid-binding protein
VRVALDTNVLVYAEGVNGAPRRKTALDVIERLPAETTFVPVQVLGELFHVLVRKAQWEPKRALKGILSWQDTFSLIETSSLVLFTASELSVHHNIAIWDAVVLSAAATSGCRVLLSEDFHTVFTWNGVTVVNPFADSKHSLLAELLGK